MTDPAATRRKRCFGIGLAAAGIAGALLAVMQASLLVGGIVTVVLSAVLTPWIMLGGRRAR